ncbi:ParB family chromosome partitioning protein [Aminobacter aminovorans]|uniref:Chromosome-partitioning protein parB n=1 Tax=Aminobacter aminovorans TaxID=83263 RepID=A0A381IKI1_AMIAI|nr:plasmid partitioning protein RepB [Aminobacter aminovorans]TCS20473.1 ParB family chromosome partitioning protein [Aminobacter aminovorans]SUY28230.1 Chromosome-partitioning protein parB [Aminobacter aminovorans]
MARKNLIEVSGSNEPLRAAETLSASRPIAGLVSSAARSTSPVGGIAKTLGNITQKVERAHDLERQMAEGQTVVELDTSLLDASIVRDRMEMDAIELAQLVEQIRDHGQQVPILVRPHPEAKGRFQVAYGHRRLAAVSQLGLKVRAVVRQLSDDELVVSQGQENNARANLSFIERALFAARLEDRSFSREVIMSALGVDKSALSKLIGVVRGIPLDLIEAIGPAPEVGRRRWMDLAEAIDLSAIPSLLSFLAQAEIRSADSDARFQAVFRELTKKPAKASKAAQPERWEAADRSVSATVKASGSAYTLALRNKGAAGFGGWIAGNLERLYEAYRDSENVKSGD